MIGTGSRGKRLNVLTTFLYTVEHLSLKIATWQTRYSESTPGLKVLLIPMIHTVCAQYQCQH